VAEAGDDVSVEMVEVFEGVREETLPEAGGFGEVDVTGLEEEGFVFACGNDFTCEVVGELCNEDRVRELLEKDRREIEVAVETNVVALEVPKDAEEREVGFSSRFVKPLHTMRPCAVIDHIGQMGVEGEGEKPQWAGCESRVGLSNAGWMRAGFARWGGRVVCRCRRQNEYLEGNFR